METAGFRALVGANFVGGRCLCLCAVNIIPALRLICFLHIAYSKTHLKCASGLLLQLAL